MFLAVALPLLSSSAQDAGQRWWDHELTFDSLPPEQTPAWGFRGKGGHASLEDGKLVLSTTSEAQSIAYVLEETTPHAALTVEFRVKARENLSRFAAQFNVSTNGFVYVLPITNTEEATYRLVLENDTMTLYREGEGATVLKPTADLRNQTPAAQLLFGDASSAAIGTTEWSRLRWVWGKAIHGN